jgi:dihydropteroate synthase
MGILNTTPDSFSDGGRFDAPDAAARRIEQMIAEGADIIDIGGESTRPGSEHIDAEEEIRRVVPAIEFAAHFDVPISVDTSKSAVARAAIDAGAEIINDISGLRFDVKMPVCVAESGAGLVLMHSRGEFANMHSQPPVDDIVSEVRRGLADGVSRAEAAGVERRRIVLDVGIGFGKTREQNLELLALHAEIAREFDGTPFLIGVSRKSFIGKVLGEIPPGQRLAGSLAAALYAVERGAVIVRTHDVKETADALRVHHAIAQTHRESACS